MMGIMSKHRHRRTTGGGKRWRKRNAHTERHELKSGTDTSMRNVRGASSGGMYPGSFRAGIYARNAAGNGKGAGKMIRCFLILTLKEKTYEEEKRSESTEEPAASEHGN